jgi:hypothetical protein
MLRLLIACAFATLTTSASSAAYFMYCDEPDPPYCADGYSEFEDQWEFQSCLSEMESYEDDVNEYVDCLRTNSSEAIDEYNDTVSDFNSQAGG